MKMEIEDKELSKYVESELDLDFHDAIPIEQTELQSFNFSTQNSPKSSLSSTIQNNIAPLVENKKRSLIRPKEEEKISSSSDGLKNQIFLEETAQFEPPLDKPDNFKTSSVNLKKSEKFQDAPKNQSSSIIGWLFGGSQTNQKKYVSEERNESSGGGVQKFKMRSKVMNQNQFIQPQKQQEQERRQRSSQVEKKKKSMKVQYPIIHQDDDFAERNEKMELFNDVENEIQLSLLEEGNNEEQEHREDEYYAKEDEDEEENEENLSSDDDELTKRIEKLKISTFNFGKLHQKISDVLIICQK